MATLLYIQASPRQRRSRSIAVADAFVHAFRDRHPQSDVVTLDLFTADLPELDEPTLDAKYALLRGQPVEPDQHGRWRRVETIIEQFLAADIYVLAVPMWNFSIPYRLKHYLDILIQPTYTFDVDPERGYIGRVTGRRAVAVYAQGGDYSGDMASMDTQRPYLREALGFIGITDITEITASPTAAAPETVEAAVNEAIDQARSLGERL